MTRRTNRILLTTIAAGSFFALLCYFAFEDVARDPVPPTDVAGMARWLAAHPADWLTASILTDRALDASLPRRFELWRAAYALASHLAPARPNASAAMARSGLFHWYELEDADRRRVLVAVRPLLRNPDSFRQLAVPLWTLTSDLSLLRRWNPGTPEALATIRDIAAANGLFDDYRSLREEETRARLTSFEAHPDSRDFYALLPLPVDASDEPLIRRILSEVQKHPVDTAANAAPLLDYALRHDLEPLGGFTAAVHATDLPPPLRARLALRLGMTEAARELEIAHAVSSSPEWRDYYLDASRAAERAGDRGLADAYVANAARSGIDLRVLAAAAETADPARRAQQLSALSRQARAPQWAGLCGGDVCRSASAWIWGSGTLQLSVRPVQSDAIAPYVEIYVDDALAAEGPVDSARAFDLALGDAPGLHRIEVRIANPLTRNRMERRIALG